MWSFPRIPRATRIDRAPSFGVWPMVVDDLDEPDGGTFYRPTAPTWLSGSGAPDADAGDEDDCYMDTSADPPEWYGPKGAEDEDGNGNWPGPYPLTDPGSGAWLQGGGDPNDGTGDDGDYYLDTGAMAWWGPKAAGTWEGTGPHHVRGNWIEFDAPLPRTSGLFSIPLNILSCGDTEDLSPVTADAWLELADNDGARIQLIHAAYLSADGGVAIRTGQAAMLVALTGNVQIYKARWKIVGGKGLAWSGSGNLEQLA